MGDRKLLYMAALLGWVMVLLTGALVYDAVLVVKGKSYTPPDYFIDLCKITIGGAVVALGGGGILGLRQLSAKKKSSEDTSNGG